MSMSWFLDGQAAEPVPQRGAAPVGQLSELPALERGTIAVLRLWCDGEAGQREISTAAVLAFGPARAEAQLARIEGLMIFLTHAARRPLMRHGLSCGCFGGDESAIANLVAAAVSGNRDDALVFALAVFDPAQAYAAVSAAEGFGLAVLGLSRPRPAPGPLH